MYDNIRFNYRAYSSIDLKDKPQISHYMFSHPYICYACMYSCSSCVMYIDHAANTKPTPSV